MKKFVKAMGKHQAERDSPEKIDDEEIWDPDTSDISEDENF